MPKGSQVGGFDPLALLYMVIVFAVALLVPAVLSRFVNPESSGDSDSEDGGGGGPRRPQPTPSKPSPGGLPLDNAQPSRIRLRDGRPLGQRLPARQRRSAHEPARRPMPRAPTT